VVFNSHVHNFLTCLLGTRVILNDRIAHTSQKTLKLSDPRRKFNHIRNRTSKNCIDDTYVDDEDKLLVVYETIRITTVKNEIVTYRAPVNFDGKCNRYEDPTQIHVKDITSPLYSTIWVFLAFVISKICSCDRTESK
jgi:hypothetical protein